MTATRTTGRPFRFSEFLDACRPPKGLILIETASFEAAVKARGKAPVESRIVRPGPVLAPAKRRLA